MKYSEQLWESLGFLAATTFLVFIFMSFFSDHKINRYYYESDSNQLSLYLDTDWQIDGVIYLQRDVTNDQAIELVNKLNKTLK